MVRDERTRIANTQPALIARLRSSKTRKSDWFSAEPLINPSNGVLSSTPSSSSRQQRPGNTG